MMSMYFLIQYLNLGQILEMSLYAMRWFLSKEGLEGSGFKVLQEDSGVLVEV